MNIDNIVVIGANGMLGHTLVKYLKNFYDVTALTSDDFNILHAPINALEQYLNDDTKVVINCAGVIKPRIKFYDVQEVFKINSWFPVQLGRFLSQHENWIDMIHISTDCVFTGNHGNYKETDIPDALDLYGMSKILGETCAVDAMVIRTSIIGEEIKNKYSLLEWARAEAGKTVSGWTDHIWSGVTTLELAKFIHSQINLHFVDPGIIHYASDPVNKYVLLHMINDVYNLNLKINKVDSGVSCDRSLAVVDSDYLATSLEIQLQEMREFFENGNV